MTAGSVLTKARKARVRVRGRVRGMKIKMKKRS